MWFWLGINRERTKCCVACARCSRVCKKPREGSLSCGAVIMSSGRRSLCQTATPPDPTSRLRRDMIYLEPLIEGREGATMEIIFRSPT